LLLEGGGLPLATIYRGVVPFVLIDFAALLVISYVPWCSRRLLGK
jgi:hypothetical protein